MPSCVGVACGWYLHSIKRTLNISDVSEEIKYETNKKHYENITDLANFIYIAHLIFSSSFFSLSFVFILIITMIDVTTTVITVKMTPQRMRSFLYSLAMFLMLMVMHCTYYRDMGVAIASVCILLGRPIIAISTCIFIVLNACGYNCRSSFDRDEFVWFHAFFFQFRFTQ